jgi:hypothetical protein
MAAAMVTTGRISHPLHPAGAIMFAQLHASSQSGRTTVLQVRFAGRPQSTST